MPVAAISKLELHPGKRDAAIAAIRDVLGAVEDEPGTLRHILHVDDADPDVLWFYEQFENQAALQAHGTSAEIQAALVGLREFRMERPEPTYLQVVGGKNA